MFQLIIGISLGLIFLFVIVLLITEVAATYPVWKQGERRQSSPFTDPKLENQTSKGHIKVLLLVLAGIIILGLGTYLFLIDQNPPRSIPEIKPLSGATSTGTIRQFSGRVDRHLLRYQLQTKWEDGRLYGNTVFIIGNDSSWRFNDCQFNLLDRDGFLIKQLVFSFGDFVYMINPAEQITGLTNKFNTAISLQEYQKIAKLQVVLDKKTEGPLIP